MIFASEDMSSKLLQKHVFPVDTEGLLIEINFRKSKWLLFSTYHPPSQKINIIITIRIRLLIQIFIMILLFGLFRFISKSARLKKSSGRKNMFQKCVYPSCIDLFLTNQVFSFQNTINVATGLSNSHKYVLTVLKISFSKNKLEEISYRDYKNFKSNIFYLNFLKLNYRYM